LYAFLAVERSVRVLVSVSFGGLAGRALGRRTPDAPDQLSRLTGACAQDKAESNVIVELASLERGIRESVEALTLPLFANFDFYELPANERNRLIRKNLVDWGFGDISESS
jgi:hypothetical protein